MKWNNILTIISSIILLLVYIVFGDSIFKLHNIFGVLLLFIVNMLYIFCLIYNIVQIIKKKNLKHNIILTIILVLCAMISSYVNSYFYLSTYNIDKENVYYEYTFSYKNVDYYINGYDNNKEKSYSFTLKHLNKDYLISGVIDCELNDNSIYVKDNLVLIKCSDKEDIIINYDLNNLYYKKGLKLNYNLNDLKISKVEYDYIYLEGENKSVKCSIKNERCISVD